MFKGKITRTNVADNAKYKWSVSRSDRLEQMLKLSVTFLISSIRLLQKISPFTFRWLHCPSNPWNYKGDVPKKKCSIFYGKKHNWICKGLHDHLKDRYRKQEMKLMLKKLEIDKKKVPSPSCEQIIDLLLGTWKEASVDFNAVF